MKHPLAPFAVIIIGLVAILGYIRYLISFEWVKATPLHRYAIAAGTLAPFIFFSFFQEVDSSRADDTTRMTLVGTIFLISLIVMNRNLKKNNRINY